MHNLFAYLELAFFIEIFTNFKHVQSIYVSIELYFLCSRSPRTVQVRLRFYGNETRLLVVNVPSIIRDSATRFVYKGQELRLVGDLLITKYINQTEILPVNITTTPQPPTTPSPIKFSKLPIFHFSSSNLASETLLEGKHIICILDTYLFQEGDINYRCPMSSS